MGLLAAIFLFGMIVTGIVSIGLLFALSFQGSTPRNRLVGGAEVPVESRSGGRRSGRNGERR